MSLLSSACVRAFKRGYNLRNILELFKKYVSAFVCVCVRAFKRGYNLWGSHYCHNKERGKYLYGLLYGPFQLYTIISNVLACATTISVLHIL